MHPIATRTWIEFSVRIEVTAEKWLGLTLNARREQVEGIDKINSRLETF
jgi:hypothetical protein